jgi:hypothetical protein
MKIFDVVVKAIDGREHTERVIAESSDEAKIQILRKYMNHKRYDGNCVPYPPKQILN